MKAWDDIAQLRAKQIEEGKDITFCEVFLPFYRKALSNASRILDFGCGTGHLIADLSLRFRRKRFVGFDPSKGMIEVALKVMNNSGRENVQLSSSRIFIEKQEKFDLIISHLTFHVIRNLSIELSRLHDLLKIHGQLIVAIPHPCFWNDYKQPIPENEYVYMKNKAVAKSRLHITKDPNNVMFTPYIHRPISEYSRLFFGSGFVIEVVEEIFPSAHIQKKYGEKWKYPRYLVFRLRKK